MCKTITCCLMSAVQQKFRIQRPLMKPAFSCCLCDIMKRAAFHWTDVISVIFRFAMLRYDSRCYILTCARKPTSVILIYRTEPTTKKCKNRKKTKSRKQIRSEITVNSQGNPRSKYLSRKKERAAVGRICREGRTPGKKE